MAWNSLEAGIRHPKARVGGPCSTIHVRRTQRRAVLHDCTRPPPPAVVILVTYDNSASEAGLQEHTSARGAKGVTRLIFLNPNSRE